MLKSMLPLCLLVISVAGAAEPKHPLTWVPADVPYYYHLDFEAMDKAKLGEDLKSVKSYKLKEWMERQSEWSVVPITQMKSNTCYTEGELDKPNGTADVSLHVARQKLDATALDKITKMLTGSKNFVGSEGKSYTLNTERDRQRTFDFSQPDRWSSWERYKDRPFPKIEEKGIHAKALVSQQGAMIAAGVSVSDLPTVFHTPNLLPAEWKFLTPLMETRGAWFDGRLVKSELQITITVEAKTNEEAVVVAKKLGEGRPTIQKYIKDMKESATRDQTEPKPLADWFDRLAKAVEDGTFSTKDNTVVFLLTMPMKESLAPVLVYLAGGGRADDSAVGQQLRDIGVAMHTFNDIYGKLPPVAPLAKEQKLHSWRVLILPMLGKEERDLYSKFKLEEDWNSAHNKKVLEENPIPKIFANEGADRSKDKTTRLQVFTGKGSSFDPDKTDLAVQRMRDGTSNTGLVFQAAKAVEWTKPEDLKFDPEAKLLPLLWFSEEGTTVVLMGDGSVRNVKLKKVTEEKLKAAITPNGGEANSVDDD
jgi:Protein of unknown function (DUF1559)